ncbi:MAG: Asp-tRNA(Asn)/Glu-tRNA(Gln) amidotransferase subunit GatA [Candidatus Sungbacteria bacterium]|nr:Asp-tRNA(Asn)/Glu-tRNA(Gln) amidotransferase subunit GatA [Candidatus Sungbacteria bacterium]
MFSPDAVSIESLKDGLRNRHFSAREVVESYLANIASQDKELHAYLFVNDEGAREAADAMDAALADGKQGSLPLLGVPMAVKDNILVCDWPTTAASRVLEPYVASYEATVVSRLRNAGAIFLGKTNMDEFAMGSSTENSAFGPTRNPRNAGRVPGGSSGGSAAAVGAGLALVALGSDTGGSIRQPAAFSGVVGLKPTYGRVSRHGLIAMASSLDQIGSLARSVRDASLLYEVIAGHDRYDATSDPRPVEAIKSLSDLHGVSIGVPKEYFTEGLDSRIKAVIRSALVKFEKAGANLVEVSLPHSQYALSCYYIIMPAEVSANLARFDGLRYGFVSKEAKNLAELYKNTRDEGLGDEVKRRIMIGTYVLSHGYYDAYYAKAGKVRHLVRSDFTEAFKKVDVVMGPTTPSLPFRFGEKSADPVSMYLEDIYTVSINLAGVPALSMPCGSVAEDGEALPVGLQIIGKWFDEASLLGVAEQCEHVLK